MICPCCGSEDADSRRHDDCSSCGWAQTSPIQDQLTAKKACPICHRCGEPLDKLGVKAYAWDKNGGESACLHYKPTPPADVSEGNTPPRAKDACFYPEEWAKPANPHRTCGRLDHKMGCDCDLKKPAEQVACFCGGSDQTGHIPTECHTEHKPPLPRELDDAIELAVLNLTRNKYNYGVGVKEILMNLCALVRDGMRGR